MMCALNNTLQKLVHTCMRVHVLMLNHMGPHDAYTAVMIAHDTKRVSSHYWLARRQHENNGSYVNFATSKLAFEAGLSSLVLSLDSKRTL